jgi:hypothetical protein
MYLRTRGFYLLAMIVTIMLGLGSRAFPSVLPYVVVAHFGDALWAAMIYFGVRALLVRLPYGQAFVLSLAFCFAIELSQLYQAEWINGVRGTLVGALVLGSGFLYVDLVRYTAGAMAAYVLDRLVNGYKAA